MTRLCKQAVTLAQDVPETGDSLIRLLLNISAIQTPLAFFLLKQLPTLQNAMEVDSTDALPQLVLGSLRWCDADLSLEPHHPSQHQHWHSMDNDTHINFVPAAAKAVNVNGKMLISMHCNCWCCYVCIIIFAFWLTILKQAMSIVTQKRLSLAVVFQVLTPQKQIQYCP